MKSSSFPLREYESQLGRRNAEFASDLSRACQSWLAQIEAQCPGLSSAPVTGVARIRISLALRAETLLPIVQEYIRQEQARVTAEVCSSLQGSMGESVTSDVPGVVLMLPRSEISELDQLTETTPIVMNMLCNFIATVDDIVPQQQNVRPAIEICIDVPDPRGSKTFRYVESKGRSVPEILRLPTVTLDTNVMTDFWAKRERYKHVKELLNRGKVRKIDLAVTSRICDDITEPPLAEKINSLRVLSIHDIGSVIRTICWNVGFDIAGVAEFRDFFKSPRVTKKLEQMNTNKRPDWRDWDHVHTHYRYERDHFLTWDKGILHFSNELREELGIKVMTPETYLRLGLLPIVEVPLSQDGRPSDAVRRGDQQAAVLM